MAGRKRHSADHWLHHRVAALNLRRLITIGLTHTGTTWATSPNNTRGESRGPEQPMPRSTWRGDLRVDPRV
jgi:hypothetical protein